jgi:hypothetical protein
VNAAAPSFAIAGSHPVDGPDDRQWFDAVDAVVALGDRRVAFGVRTAGYVRMADRLDADWRGGYTPLRIAIDLAEPRFWDFDRVLWIGPAGHPCVIWSNAAALTATAIAHVLTARDCVVLRGPSGNGLPDAAAVGLSVPDAAAWLACTPAT